MNENSENLHEKLTEQLIAVRGIIENLNEQLSELLGAIEQLSELLGVIKEVLDDAYSFSVINNRDVRIVSGVLLDRLRQAAQPFLVEPKV